MSIKSILTLAVVALATAVAAGAQTTVALPDESQTTTLEAIVSEQATVTVPSTVTFNVTDISLDTPGSAAPMTVSNIVLESDTKQLMISVKANSASFSGPDSSYSASDVIWGAATWTNATSAAGTLSTVYQELATCSAGVASCSTTDVGFTLKRSAFRIKWGRFVITLTFKLTVTLS